jgi:hypothetical protein
MADSNPISPLLVGLGLGAGVGLGVGPGDFVPCFVDELPEEPDVRVWLLAALLSAEGDELALGLAWGFDV